MKKTFVIFIVLICLVVLISCARKKPTEVIFDTPVPSATRTLVPSATLTRTLGVTLTHTPIVTLTGTHTQVNTMTQTVMAHTMTVTQTVFQTVTATPTVTSTTFVPCSYIPRVADFGVDKGFAYYAFTAGNTITAVTFSTVAGVAFNYAYYDGSHTLVKSGPVISGPGGCTGLDYIIQGTENISSRWLFILLPDTVAAPASFTPGTDIFPATTVYDNDKFFVVAIVPTPTSTPGCMDMPRIGPVVGCYLQQYIYKLNCGTEIYYLDRWPSSSAVNVAWYDGANALVNVNYNSTDPMGIYGGLRGSYTMTGAESTGLWHVVLFAVAVTPPATYTTGLPNCGQAAFNVENINSPVVYP